MTVLPAGMCLPGKKTTRERLHGIVRVSRAHLRDLWTVRCSHGAHRDRHSRRVRNPVLCHWMDSFEGLPLMKYKIVRMFLNHPTETLKKNVSLEEAQRHCSDPETSSKTCTKAENISLTERAGPWFDGYDDM